MFRAMQALEADALVVLGNAKGDPCQRKLEREGGVGEGSHEKREEPVTTLFTIAQARII